jgi:hypothetical protein
MLLRGLILHVASVVHSSSIRWHQIAASLIILSINYVNEVKSRSLGRETIAPIDYRRLSKKKKRHSLAFLLLMNIDSSSRR